MARRRGLAVVLTALIALALLAPSVLAAEETVEDKFATTSYSGGLGWIGNWTETGETTNPSSGVIQIVSSGCDGSNCVRFESLLTIGVGLQRSANFDGAENVSLTFRYRKSGGTLEVRARTGSGPWQGVDTLGDSGGYTNATIDLSDYASPTMQIMFFSTIGVLSSAHIDNVLITASYPTTTTSTTTTPTTSTTTTSGPTITVPTVTLPTVTVPPLLTTTTTVSSSTTTTSGGSGTSTTTTTTEGTGTTSTTTSTTSPGTGGSGSDSSPGGGSAGDGDQATVQTPLTDEQLDSAAESNIVVNLAGEGDFGGFEPGIGINPMTDLWVNLNTTVEAISTEILSALALGSMVAFFGVRRVKDDDPAPQA
jgi:hypothetical protein